MYIYLAIYKYLFLQFSQFSQLKSKLIIFDLDGTLIDTLNDIKHIFNYVLVQNSFEKKSKEFYKKNIGNGLENLLKK